MRDCLARLRRLLQSSRLRAEWNVSRWILWRCWSPGLLGRWSCCTCDVLWHYLGIRWFALSFRYLRFPCAHSKGTLESRIYQNFVQSFFLVDVFGRLRCSFRCDSLCVFDRRSEHVPRPGWCHCTQRGRGLAGSLVRCTCWFFFNPNMHIIHSVYTCTFIYTLSCV